ncbi:hypothetical protein LTR95_002271 [Oleoguttula sp. CCFEE 5521]
MRDQLRARPTFHKGRPRLSASLQSRPWWAITREQRGAYLLHPARSLQRAGQRARNHPIQKADHPNDTPAPNGSIDSDSVTSQLRRPLEKPTKFIHLDYPTVVEVDGIWVELTCKDIAANAVRDSSEFMQSEMAFRAYAKESYDAITHAGLAGFCNMRTFSARDIDLMQADRRIERIGYFAIAARAANVPCSDAGLQSQLTIAPSAAMADPGYGRAKTAPPSEKKPTFGDLFSSPISVTATVHENLALLNPHRHICAILGLERTGS